MFPAFFAGLFTLLLLGVVGAVGFALFFALWYAGVALAKPKRRKRWLVASLPIYLVLFVLSIGALWSAWTSPKSVFRNTFGFEATESVTELQTHLYSFADTSVAHLYFKSDRDTVDRIVARGMNSSVESPSRQNYPRRR